MRVKRIGTHSLPLPKQHTEAAAGFDLQSTEDVMIKPGHSALVGTGFAWAIPKGYVGIIRDRSCMAVKRAITTRAGVIDSDYRGEVKVCLVNEGVTPEHIAASERIAQMLITNYHKEECHEVDELDDTARGAGGFGSTGTA